MEVPCGLVVSAFTYHQGDPGSHPSSDKKKKNLKIYLFEMTKGKTKVKKNLKKSKKNLHTKHRKKTRNFALI